MSAAAAPNVQGLDNPDRRKVFSLCGMCATRCPMEVTVENGQVVWLEGNKNDPAIGSSLCARGAAGLSLEYDHERPQGPMIRTGARGAGQWKHASWDEALDYVADRLQSVMAEMGPRAVALSDRSGYFIDLTQTFVKALGSPNYFDHDVSCGRNCNNAARTVFGVGRGAIGFDLKGCKHLVLYGRNIVESLMVKEAKGFMSARGRGMKCTYIDPRATLTASKATRYWQIRPNSDYALNLAIIHEILHKNLYDRAFVERFVSGLDALREAVKTCTPEWQAAHTGISAEALREFVQEVCADAPHVIFHPGWMTARHKQSFYVSRSSMIINALLGAVEVSGGYVMAKTPEDVGRKGLKKLADRAPKVSEPRLDGAGSAEHPQWDPVGGILHKMYAALETGKPYPIGAYFTYRHDPLTGLPDADSQKKALDQLKLLVAIDVRYSETAWYADVFLPEASYLERANILAQVNGPKPMFSLRDQAMAPRHDTRPAWWIFREILRRVGKGDALNFESIEDIWRYQLQDTGVTIEQLREKGFVGLCDAPVMRSRDELQFKTPSGKIEFESSMLKQAKLPSLPPYTPTAPVTGNQFYLVFGRPATLSHGQSLNNPLLKELVPEQTLWMNPLRAQTLHIKEGDQVSVNGGGSYTGRLKVHVTPWIHPEAVFMMHGFGSTVPLHSRSYNQGVADQRLQHGKLHEYDPIGGGNAMTETIVSVSRCGA